MEVRVQDKQEAPLKGIDPVLAEITKRLRSHPQEWLHSLQENPAGFADLEKKVHHAFAQMADQLVAGLLAQATKGDDFVDNAKKKTTANGERRFRSARPCTLKLRLLGGLVLWVSTLYCAALTVRKSGRRRGGEGGGIYPELGWLGFLEGKSPALVRDVARQVALLPSYAVARAELLERGLNLNSKEIHNISVHAGQAAITFRRRELELFRKDKLPTANGQGKRFGAMIDGGRTKLRKTTRRQKGRGQAKTQKRRFKTAWREVKQIIVFEMDEQGRMKKGTQPIFDGTFQGPNEIMEVLAMRLHQVGASQAEVVAFRCDGAPWIWDRLAWVKTRLGLSDKQVSLGLDWCHAVHHVSLALAMVLQGAERKRVFKKLRKWLKAGRWQKVVDELVRLATAAKLPQKSAVWTEIAYLDRHGEDGHLDYATYRRRGLPMGSGAIESAIRRVINLRLKGNSIFWDEENAEGMLQIRGLALSGRWGATFSNITASLASDRRLEWHWRSPDMTAELKTPAAVPIPTPQPPTVLTTYNAAA
jgi:hypothetical protein